jgi:ribosome biogenesis protein UTP30
MTPDQVAANLDAVVSVLTEKYIPQGWRNIRSLHIKGPNTAALPIWLADELWTDENDVLESLPAPVIKDKKKRKRALLETTAETDDATKTKADGASDETKAKKSKSDNAEKAARKAALKKQKEESKTAIAA